MFTVAVSEPVFDTDSLPKAIVCGVVAPLDICVW